MPVCRIPLHPPQRMPLSWVALRWCRCPRTAPHRRTRPPPAMLRPPRPFWPTDSLCPMVQPVGPRRMRRPDLPTWRKLCRPSLRRHQCLRGPCLKSQRRCRKPALFQPNRRMLSRWMRMRRRLSLCLPYLCRLYPPNPFSPLPAHRNRWALQRQLWCNLFRDSRLRVICRPLISAPFHCHTWSPSTRPAMRGQPRRLSPWPICPWHW